MRPPARPAAGDSERLHPVQTRSHRVAIYGCPGTFIIIIVIKDHAALVDEPPRLPRGIIRSICRHRSRDIRRSPHLPRSFTNGASLISVVIIT